MSQLILPKLPPPQGAAETTATASAGKLTAVASGQPFEDFLNAKQGNIGNQPHESDLQSGPPVTARKKTPRAAVATQASPPPPMTVAPATACEAAAAQAIATQATPSAPAILVKTSEGIAAPAQSPKAAKAKAEAPAVTPVTALTTSALPVSTPTAPSKQTRSTASRPAATAVAAPGATAPAAIAALAPAPTTPGSVAHTTVPVPAPLVAPPGTAPLAASSLPAAPIKPLAATTAPLPLTPGKTAPSDPGQPLAPVPAPPADELKNQAAAPLEPPAEPADQEQAAAVMAEASSNTPRLIPSSTTGGRPKAKAAEIADRVQSASAKPSEKAASQSPPPVEEPPAEQVAPIGTAIAKQNPAMSNTAQLPQREAFFREDAPAAVFAAPAQPPQAPGAGKIIPLPQAHDSQPASAPAAPIPSFSISSSAALIGKAPGAPAAQTSQSLASTALNQVLNSADKMTSDGSSHVAVQINLGDGQQLTVRLQMSQGTIHPIFKTESPELRQAIEQNWSGFRTGASERGLQIATPVFESAGSEGGFNAFANGNQSRQHDTEPSEADSPAAAIPQPSRTNQILPMPPSPPPAGTSVQMYA